MIQFVYSYLEDIAGQHEIMKYFMNENIFLLILEKLHAVVLLTKTKEKAGNKIMMMLLQENTPHGLLQFFHFFINKDIIMENMCV